MLALSLAAHAGILTLLVVGGGAMVYRVQRDEDAVRIELLRPSPQKAAPRAPTQEEARTASPVRARAAARQALPQPVAASPIPAAPSTAPGRGEPGRIGTAPHPGPLPPGTRDNVRAALRSSSFACANEDAVGLTRDERNRCADREGAMRRSGPRYDAAIAPGKRAAYDRAAARQEADRRYRETAPSGGGLTQQGSGPNGPPKEIPWP